MSYVYIL